MFERYTEQARRVVFFARDEASALGSPYIELEHVLLGMLRESNILKDRIPQPSRDQIRQEIEESSAKRDSTSVDLPMSRDVKRALSIGADEATEMGHRNIDVGHLVLGLMRVEGSIVKDILGRHGIVYAEFRELVRGRDPAPPPRFQMTAAEFEPVELDVSAAAPSLQNTITRLHQLILRLVYEAGTQSEAYGYRRLKRKPWTRAQAIGHLIDWATTHHGWFARAMVETTLTVAGYPADEWVPPQNYQDFGWPEIVQVWAALNRLLLHVLMQAPEQRVNTPCRIGLSDPIPLAKLASDYVEHCDDMIGQVLAHL